MVRIRVRPIILSFAWNQIVSPLYQCIYAKRIKVSTQGLICTFVVDSWGGLFNAETQYLECYLIHILICFNLYFHAGKRKHFNNILLEDWFEEPYSLIITLPLGMKYKLQMVQTAHSLLFRAWDINFELTILNSKNTLGQKSNLCGRMAEGLMSLWNTNIMV